MLGLALVLVGVEAVGLPLLDGLLGNLDDGGLDTLNALGLFETLGIAKVGALALLVVFLDGVLAVG